MDTTQEQTTSPTYQIVPQGSVQKVSTCRDLILLSDQTHTLEFHIELQQVKRIDRALKDKNEILNQMQARVTSMNVLMLKFFPQLHEQIRKLEHQKLAFVNPASAELKRAYEEQREKDPVQAEIDLKNKLDAEAEANLRRMRKADPNKTLKIKKLWAKISRKCHPDVTKDTIMHDLFMLGKEYYNTNDFDGMKLLWHSVAEYVKAHRRPDWLRKHIQFRKSNLLNMLGKISQLVAEEKNSVGWKYVTLVDSGQMEAACRGYKELMEQRVNSLHAELAKLEEKKQAELRAQELRDNNPGIRIYQTMASTSFRFNRS